MKQSSDDAYKKLMQHLREKEDQFLKEMVGSQEYNPKILPRVWNYTYWSTLLAMSC